MYYKNKKAKQLTARITSLVLTFILSTCLFANETVSLTSTGNIYNIDPGKAITMQNKFAEGETSLSRTCFYNNQLTIQSARLIDECYRRNFAMTSKGEVIYRIDLNKGYVNKLPVIPNVPYTFKYVISDLGVSCDFGANLNITLTNHSKNIVSVACY